MVIVSDTAALLEALQFASSKHQHQRRKGEDASPYINHPIAVAHVLATIGSVTDLATLTAAILHDVIEDTETTPEELDERFGAEVRGLVEEVTDDKRLNKQVRKELQIEHVPGLSPRAKMIKLGDLSCNIVDLTQNPPLTWSLERRCKYVDWTERVIAGCRGVNEGLERRYDEVLHQGRKVFQA